MEVSKRLDCIAQMVTKGNVVCDVGTDHGYLAIHLIEQNISPKVIAMDVAKGPLSKAVTNINNCGLSEKITTRLSDGVAKLLKGEAQTVVIAGMGGVLITQILERGHDILESVDELILSPHTDVALVRLYLQDKGYEIACEEMLIDEGKFYTIIKAKHGKMLYNKCELSYGKYLLCNKNLILKEFLLEEANKINKIKQSLTNVNTENAADRILELDEKLCCIMEGLKYYEM